MKSSKSTVGRDGTTFTPSFCQLLPNLRHLTLKTSIQLDEDTYDVTSLHRPLAGGHPCIREMTLNFWGLLGGVRSVLAPRVQGDVLPLPTVRRTLFPPLKVIHLSEEVFPCQGLVRSSLSASRSSSDTANPGVSQTTGRPGRLLTSTSFAVSSITSPPLSSDLLWPPTS